MGCVANGVWRERNVRAIAVASYRVKACRATTEFQRLTPHHELRCPSPTAHSLLNDFSLGLLSETTVSATLTMDHDLLGGRWSRRPSKARTPGLRDRCLRCEAHISNLLPGMLCGDCRLGLANPHPQRTHPQTTARDSNHSVSATPSTSSATDQPQSQNLRGVSMVGTDFRNSTLGLPGGGVDNMTPPIRHGRSPVVPPGSRPVSTMVDFQRVGGGPDDVMIVDAIRSCLAEVDLDNVTKKQGKGFSFHLINIIYDSQALIISPCLQCAR